MWLHALLSSVDCEFAGWPVSPAARVALSARARAGGVSGLWTLTIWPSGGWFPHWLPLFPVNNWDLICEEISKAPVTPLLHSDRFLALALKETSPSRVALRRPWVVEVWQWAFSLRDEKKSTLLAIKMDQYEIQATWLNIKRHNPVHPQKMPCLK